MIFFSILATFYCVKKESYTFQKNESNSKKSNLLMIASNLTDTKFMKVKKELQIIDKFNLLKNTKRQISGSILMDINTNELSFTTLFLKNSKYNNKKVIARGKYTKTLNEIGWSKLFIETFNNCSSEIQSFAAGYLEGKLTSRNILEFYKNLVGIHSGEEQELKDVFKYYGEVESSIRKKTSKQFLATLTNENEIEYWITVAMVQAQTDGLYEGYNSEMKNIEALSFEQFYFINADGEVPELMTLFKTKRENQGGLNNSNIDTKFSFKQREKIEKFSPEYLKMYFGESDPELLWQKLMSKSHCTAFIRPVIDYNGNLQDLFVSHTTWDSYSEMHRIFKVYDLKYDLFGKEKQSKIMFSSYPGTLTSTDDFYMLNSKITVLETTLEILDRELYLTSSAGPQNHIPNYIRISTANRIAETGREWADIFKKNNSGTYNSQWMIVDFSVLYSVSQNEDFNQNDSLFNTIKHDDNLLNNLNYYSFKQKLGNISDSFFNSTKSKAINIHDQKSLNQMKNFFIVLEQIPGYIEIQDMTNILLKNQYWASYNRPYFENIYEKSGYQEMMKKYGLIYSYLDNPRAKIFANKVNQIRNIEDVKNIMQSTKDLNGDISINSVSPRFDLSSDPRLRRSSGGIDTKITSMFMIKQDKTVTISGPSYKDNGFPFSWSKFSSDPHYGLPLYWKFDWLELNYNNIKGN